MHVLGELKLILLYFEDLFTVYELKTRLKILFKTVLAAYFKYFKIGNRLQLCIKFQFKKGYNSLSDTCNDSSIVKQMCSIVFHEINK